MINENNKFVPHLVLVEHYNKCNLRCPFCARTYMDEPEKKLDIDLATKIFEDLGTWIKKCRFDLTPIAEPFLNDLLFEYVKLIDKNISAPYIMAFTNGIPLLKKPSLIFDFYNAGGHQIVIDIYTPFLYKPIMDMVSNILQRLEKIGVHTIIYYDNKNYSVDFYTGEKTKKVLLYSHKGSKKYLVINQPYLVEARGKGVCRKFHNMAGHIPPNVAGVDYKTKPFRYCMRPYRELVIDYFGCVRLCCLCVWNDIVLGKYPEDGSLEEIWNNDLMWVYRWFLRHAKVKRVLPPCRECSYHGSFRPIEGVSKPDFINVDDLNEVYKYIESTQKKYLKYKHRLYFNCPWKRDSYKILTLDKFI